MADIAESPFPDIPSLMPKLDTVIDYVRFCMTQMHAYDVYFGHGTENAYQEAHSLVFSALQLPVNASEQEQAVFYPCRLIDSEKKLILSWLKIRCEEAVPLPYLSNQAWFAGMPFYVDERVLIPRSPFAQLINNKFSSYLEGNEPDSILDMCCGGGCIAVALAHCFEEAVVDAVDIDFDALEVASHNIEQYQLEERVFPIQSDLFSNLDGQKYDLIVINPPYVDAEDMNDLPREYHHEPRHALESGSDGLDLTLQILKQAASYMTDTAWLFVEVGNSEVNFTERFGAFSVQWCELTNGGSGIFAISKTQLETQLHLLSEIQ